MCFYLKAKKGFKFLCFLFFLVKKKSAIFIKKLNEINIFFLKLLAFQRVLKTYLFHLLFSRIQKKFQKIDATIFILSKWL